MLEYGHSKVIPPFVKDLEAQGLRIVSGTHIDPVNGSIFCLQGDGYQVLSHELENPQSETWSTTVGYGTIHESAEENFRYMGF